MKLADIPDLLQPTGVEIIHFVDGSQTEIPKASPTFSRWRGEPIANDYGGKAVLDWHGEPVFAELLILRLLQSTGWEGVWVDTYGRRHRRSLTDDIELPVNAAQLLAKIRKSAETHGGCFDVFAWRDDRWLFAEAKLSTQDWVKPPQKRWLSAALAENIPGATFLIVEWRAN